MDDKELADKVVALGVGYYGDDPDGYWNSHDESIADYLNSSQFVRDWRVAGALMEEVREDITIPSYDNACIIGRKLPVYDNESLPRAIIEACVEALASEAEDD